MTTTFARTDPVNSLIDPPQGTALAVSYLRVSTKEQAEKGGTEEGFSIPAQREANRRKAEQLGAVVVEEFVDAGESARKADRPELMRMIQYIKRNRVAYCIVHKVDRLARNRADDVTIHVALQEAGVMLVSATENIDETPSGMLLHGIMSSIAEFYSRNLATEVVKGMTQKAAGGGTIGKAPIGYLNVRVRDELGREVRTVELDPDRAPLIGWAFKAYASGSWTVSQLHEELTSRGLTSLPTPKRPSRPLAVSSVHRLLTNPYYKGDVIYRGINYKGAHQPLVPAEVWYQVQSVLTAHKTAGEATQVHDHYLKGTVYCGACGSRLIVSNAKNGQGNVYPYFVCSGRHSKRTDCTRQAVLIEDVEHLIEDYYQRVQITPAHREALAGMLHHEFDRLMSAEADELAQLTTNRDRLEHEQDRLMQAHYADAIPLAVLKREQDRILAELDLVNRRLDAHHSEYTDARAHLDDALNLLENCADIYARCDDANRRLCNQAFFTKVYLDEDDHLRVENARPFEMLLDPEINANALTWAADADKARTPAIDSSGQGSSLVHQVHGGAAVVIRLPPLSSRCRNEVSPGNQLVVPVVTIGADLSLSWRGNVESSNPAFARRPEFSQSRPVAQQPPMNPYGQAGYGQPTYAPPGYGQSAPTQQGYGYPQPGVAQPHYGRGQDAGFQPVTDRMTIDDVVVKTGVLFGIMILGAMATFFVGRNNPGLMMLGLIGSMAAVMVLGFVIALTKTVQPALILVFAAFEGVFVGAISYVYDANFGDATGSLVGQAVLATMSVFAGMLVAYRMNVIRATPKFTRILIMATIGYLIFALMNMVAVFVFHTTSVYQMGLLGIGVSILGVGLASLNLVLDFDFVERGIANGLPRNYAWMAGYGLLVTLVWLYVEILRLLAILRGND